MSITTPNMNLIESTIGVDTGLSWEQNLNTSLSIIDGHNHQPGSGVPITAGAINIDADLPFNGHNLTLVRSVRFQAQGSPISGATDLDCVYVSGVDLYYNDGVGNIIRITQAGNVAGTAGSISGLTAPASVSYSSVTKTFTFQSAVNTAGNIDTGSVTIRPVIASADGITLSAPSALSVNYALTYPSTAPASGSYLHYDSSGVGTWLADYDAIVGSSAQVAAGQATYSSIGAAITALSAGNSIYVLNGSYTENVSVSKRLNIVGQGFGVAITGTWSFVNASYCQVRGINFSGNLTLDATSNGNFMEACYIGSSSTASDSGAGNWILLVQG